MDTSESTINMDTNEQGAIRPNNLISEFPSLSDPIQKTAPKAQIDDEDLAYNVLSMDAGWKQLKNYIENVLIEELEAMVRSRMEQGASFEEIGQKTTVKEIAKGYLMRVITKVEDAREAVQNNAIG